MYLKKKKQVILKLIIFNDIHSCSKYNFQKNFFSYPSFGCFRYLHGTLSQSSSTEW